MPFLLPTARIFVTVASRAAPTSIPTRLEAPDRQATYAHISHALLLTSPVSGLKSPRTQIAVGPENLRAGRVCLGCGGRFDHGIVSAQLYPVLADHHVLSVNSPDHDSVARIGSIDSLLDGLARPNDRALPLRRSRSPPPAPPRLPPTGSGPWWPTTVWCVS